MRPKGRKCARNWTAHEAMLLREHVLTGQITAEQAAPILKRTIAATQTRCSFLKRGKQYTYEKRKRPKPAPSGCIRPCMCCGNSFHSVGAHNRMCEDCRHKSSDMALGMDPSFVRIGVP